VKLIIDYPTIDFFHRYYYFLSNVITIFVVETTLSSHFDWFSVFTSSNLSLKLSYTNVSKLSIPLSRYVQLSAILHSIAGY